jgi:hypothetical protein
MAATRKPKRYTLDIESPGNGRVGKATVLVRDPEGKTVGSDRANLSDATERRKLVRRLAAALGVDADALLKKLVTAWNKVLDEQRRFREQAAAGSPEAAPTPLRVGEYLVAGNQVCMRKQTVTGPVVLPLCNFVAKITREVIHDYGNGERQHHFEIEGTLADGTPLSATLVPSGQFAGLNWVPEAWGHRAVVFAGQGSKDHLRAALQLLSEDAVREIVYQHSGWRQEGGTWFYLHAGGGLGPNGPLPGALVGLPPQLQHAVLPDPPAGEALVQAVRASLRILDLGPDHVGVAAAGAAYRAVLGGCDFSLHLSGPTGVFKTELAALIQQHFGPGFDSRHLPGNWTSTANATEGLAFSAKDLVLVVDDFSPHGAATDVARMHKEADRIFRNTGNQSARQRMACDGSLRVPRPPRCLVVSTGEDLPRGHSCRARVILIEVSKDDVDKDRLTACQADASRGSYAAALSSFVCWLAPRYGQVQGGLGDLLTRFRTELQVTDQHRRSVANLAQLLLGWHYFLDFAQETGAISLAERQAYWARVQAAVVEIGAEQHAAQQDAEPCSQFLRLLRSCIASEKVHLADASGAEPDHPESWGWRLRRVGTGDFEREEWQPQGERIGWLNGAEILLDPDGSHAAVQKLAVQQGEALCLSVPTLGKRLQERGLLVESDPKHRTVRRQLQGRRLRVWCLAAAGFFSPPPKSGPSGPFGPQEAQTGGSKPVAATTLWTEGDDSEKKRSTEAVQGTASGTASGTAFAGAGEKRSTEAAPQPVNTQGFVNPVDRMDRMDRFSEGGEPPAVGNGAPPPAGPVLVLLETGRIVRVASLDLAPEGATHWSREGAAGWTPLPERGA